MESGVRLINIRNFATAIVVVIFGRAFFFWGDHVEGILVGILQFLYITPYETYSVYNKCFHLFCSKPDTPQQSWFVTVHDISKAHFPGLFEKIICQIHPRSLFFTTGGKYIKTRLAFKITSLKFCLLY